MSSIGWMLVGLGMIGLGLLRLLLDRRKQLDAVNTFRMLGGIPPGQVPSQSSAELLEFCKSQAKGNQRELEMRICRAFYLKMPEWHR